MNDTVKCDELVEPTTVVPFASRMHDTTMHPTTLSFANLQIIENEVAYSVFLLAAAADVMANGIAGDVNSRWLSFVDSFSHNAFWSVDEPELSLQSRLLGAILSKYGSGLTISILLGVMPAFLQTNTSLAFAIALVLAHSNINLARMVRSRKGPWRWLFVGLGTLYKSRKVRFAVTKCNSLPQSIFLGTLSVELTGWFVVATRGYLRGEKPLRNMMLHIYLNRWRFVFTFGAILAVHFGWHPVVLLVCLGLHKASSPNETGNKLIFEL